MDSSDGQGDEVTLLDNWRESLQNEESTDSLEGLIGGLKAKYPTEWIARKWWHFVLSEEVLSQEAEKVTRFIEMQSQTWPEIVDTSPGCLSPSKHPPTNPLSSAHQLDDSEEGSQESVNKPETRTFWQLITIFYPNAEPSFPHLTSPLLKGLVSQIEGNLDDRTRLEMFLFIEYILRLGKPSEGDCAQIEASLVRWTQLVSGQMSLPPESFLKWLLLNGGKYCLTTVTSWIHLQYFSHHTSLTSSLRLPSRVLYTFAKLSLDRFSARNEFYNSNLLFRSLFPIQSGIFYYEALFLTQGSFEIGWTTSTELYTLTVESAFKKSARRPPEKIIYLSTSDSVLGLLLDASTGHFTVTLNGEEMDQCDLCLEKETYRAVVKIISGKSQVYLNFGQFPFLYPPKIKCQNEDFEGKGHKREMYWLEIITEPLTLEAGDKTDQTMVSLGEFEPFLRVVHRSGHVPVEKAHLKAIKQLVRQPLTVPSVNLKGALATLESSEITALADVLLSQLLDFSHLIVFIDIVTQSLADGPFPRHAQMRKYLCLLLASFGVFDRITDDLLCTFFFIDSSSRRRIFTFLLSMATSSTDRYTRLFALCALRELRHPPDVVTQLKNNDSLAVLLRKSRHFWKLTCPLDLYEKLYSGDAAYLLDYQIYTLVNSLDRLLQSGEEEEGEGQFPLSSSLSNDDKFSLFSVDQLSARCRYRHCTVRSTCSTDGDGVYFYEVLLLTCASMRIGWATGRMKTVVGCNEFSIGYDGYEGTVYHEFREFSASEGPQWRVGDIVGCLLDIPKKAFIFYLNGHQVEYNIPGLYFSSEPYHAALTLFAYQQVYFNFGQSPFRYPPKRVEFREFHSLASELSSEGDGGGTSVNLAGATLENVNFMVNSQLFAKDMLFSSGKSPHKRQRLSPSSHLEDFVFQHLGNPHFHQMMVRMPKLTQIPHKHEIPFYSEFDKMIEQCINCPTTLPFARLPQTISPSQQALTYCPPPWNQVTFPSTSNPIYYHHPQAQPPYHQAPFPSSITNPSSNFAHLPSHYPSPYLASSSILPYVPPPNLPSQPNVPFYPSPNPNVSFQSSTNLYEHHAQSTPTTSTNVSTQLLPPSTIPHQFSPFVSTLLSLPQPPQDPNLPFSQPSATLPPSFPLEDRPPM